MSKRGCLLVVVVVIVGGSARRVRPAEGQEPREIAADKVPFGLLGPSTTTPGNAIVQGGPDVSLYFVDGAKLRQVPRTAPQRDVRARARPTRQGVGIE